MKKRTSGTRRRCFAFALVCTAAVFVRVGCLAQEVHVTQQKGRVILSVDAQQPYQLSIGHPPTLPVFTVECGPKGKKAGHLVLFQPGTALSEENESSSAQTITMILDDHPPAKTEWMPYGDSTTFAYYGKTEPERLAFIQLLRNSKSIALEFKPFLTGAPVTARFALSGLQDEIVKHPECAAAP